MKTPIGELQRQCPELKRRLEELGDNPSMKDVFKVMNEWEKWAVKEFRRQEQTAHSERFMTV